MHLCVISTVFLSQVQCPCWITGRQLFRTAQCNNELDRSGGWSCRTRPVERFRRRVFKLQSAQIQRENRAADSAASRRYSRLPGGYDGHHFHQGESRPSVCSHTLKPSVVSDWTGTSSDAAVEHRQLRLRPRPRPRAQSTLQSYFHNCNVRNHILLLHDALLNMTRSRGFITDKWLSRVITALVHY